MSQARILEWLKERYPKKYTAAQIVHHLKNRELSESVVYSNLKRLREKSEVGWEWGETLSSKNRPARYFYYIVETDHVVGLHSRKHKSGDNE